MIYPAEEWQAWQQEAVDDGLLEENMKAEKARIQEHCAAAQSPKSQTEDGEMQLMEFKKGEILLMHQQSRLQASIEQELANL